MNFRAVRLGLWIAAAAAVAAVFYLRQSSAPPTGPEQETPAAQETAGRSVGGPFVLTDHSSNRVTQADFAGRYMLIFFGYTFCPDICPVELSTISQALDMLEDEGIDLDRLAPLFVTVDPARDTVAAMARYVAAFHPRLIGLTGSADEIAAVTKAYGVYVSKSGGGDDYLIDHLSLIYLMGPDGALVGFFPPKRPPDELAAGLRAALTEDGDG